MLHVRGPSYRLLYNLVAAGTLVPVLLYARSLDGPIVFTWWGASRWVSPVLVAAAIGYFVAGALVYDLRAFLGLGGRPDARGAGDAPPPLERRGVLGVVRHPWYAGAIAALWVGEQDATGLATAITLSLYVIAGTLIEERRLLAEYGEEYSRYRREVPMFVPRLRLRRT